jgi:hypothetical protein
MEAPPSSTVFYNVIKYGKFALLAALLVFAFINGHKEYVAENPRKFMWDSFLVGATSAAAIAYIAHVRGHGDMIPNLAFIAFLLFFAYNVFREMSGFNAAFQDENLTQGEATQKKVLSGPLSYLMFGIACVMIVLAAAAHHGHPMGFGVLVKEGLVFAGLTAIGEGIIAWNHEEDAHGIGLAMGGNFVLFFLAHLLMQFGGFYEHIFGS